VNNARFDCGGVRYLVVFHDDRLLLTQPGWEITLAKQMSATGARYVTGDIEFWHDGPHGVLEFGNAVVPCRELPDPWRKAADRGVDLRAIGQEPGWFAEIDEERSIRIVYDNAARELTTKTPTKEVGEGSVTYLADAQGQRVMVLVEETPCADIMSGEPFPLQVTITIDDLILDGCGRRVTARSG
jgi:putative lipoprotein